MTQNAALHLNQSSLHSLRKTLCSLRLKLDCFTPLKSSKNLKMFVGVRNDALNKQSEILNPKS
jgi:hypothetical protein